MTDSEAKLNPYSPTTLTEDASETRSWARGLEGTGLEGTGEDREDVEPAATASLSRTIVRWMVVCTISAIPSFAFGLMATDGQIAGMVLGILMFVAGYTWIDFRTAPRPSRRNRRIRRTLKIAYGTRIAISILFPIGAYLDLVCGIVSVSITSPVTGLQIEEQPVGFFGALLTTLVQGCVLNLVLGAYALLVYVIQVAYGTIRKNNPPSDPM